MSWVGARAAIKSTFINTWAGQTAVALENDPFDPTSSVDTNGNPVPWVYMEIMENGSETAGFGQKGANTIRYHGLLLIHVFAPLNSGADYALGLAEQAANMFNNRSFSGVQMWVASPPSPVHRNDQFGAISGSGNWWRCYTAIPFQYDFQG